MNLQMKYIILYVSDIHQSLHFYRDILGLSLRGEHGTYIELETGDVILALNSRESVREITGLDTSKQELSQTFEIGFVAKDVQATIESLRKQDVKILMEPVVKPWGQTVAYIADPDGHYIEICSLLD